MCENKNSKTKKYDFILIVALLLVGAAIAALVYFTKASGDKVEVWVNSVLVGTYSLQVPGTYVVEGYDGGTNTLVIENGYAYLSDADCPDLTCVNMGKISRDGQSIICLPHKVVIEVVTNGEDDEIDAIVW